MFCNKCNHKLPDDSEFCQYCGIPITHDEDISDMKNIEVVTDVTESSESSQMTKTSNETLAEEPQSNPMVETLTEELPAEDIQPVQQPQIINVVEPTNTNNKKTKKKKVRYCSRCGSLIDNETKQCTRCGKKYFKGIRFNKSFFVVLSFSLVLLMAIAFIVYQYNEINVLKEEASSMQSKISSLNSKISSLNSKISSLNNQISILKTQKSKLEDENWDNYYELEFFRDHAKIVPNNNTNTYHKYGCAKLDDSARFWIFNTEAAKDHGYKQCSVCH